MSEEKKYSARDAATAVLKKAEEMLKAHALKKSEQIPQQASDEKDVTPADGVQAEPAAPEAVPRNENPDWGTAPGGVKGHVKLAKFCGHMQSKRKSSQAPGV